MHRVGKLREGRRLVKAVCCELDGLTDTGGQRDGNAETEDDAKPDLAAPELEGATRKEGLAGTVLHASSNLLLRCAAGGA